MFLRRDAWGLGHHPCRRSEARGIVSDRAGGENGAPGSAEQGKAQAGEESRRSAATVSTPGQQQQQRQHSPETRVNVVGAKYLAVLCLHIRYDQPYDERLRANCLWTRQVRTREHPAVSEGCCSTCRAISGTLDLGVDISALALCGQTAGDGESMTHNTLRRAG